MPQITITLAKLEELRMLADWQLAAQGIDPASVTAAVATVETRCLHCRKKEIVEGEQVPGYARGKAYSAKGWPMILWRGDHFSGCCSTCSKAIDNGTKIMAAF